MSDAVLQTVAEETMPAQCVSPSGRLTRSLTDSPLLWFSALTVLYLVTFLVLSSFKLLWLDELITLHIARLGSVADIWHALGNGADPNPPLMHILVHASRLVFGEHEYALRLPAMVGYWLGMLSLFAFLRRRIPIDWAMVGTVLSMTMGAFDYSFESRSYALFYGLTMSAFYCWTVSIDITNSNQTRVRATLGMALALVAAISTNYFAVLAFLPIAGGEITRSILLSRDHQRRHFSRDEPIRIWTLVRLPVWTALLLAAAPLLLYRPMIESSIAQFAPHAWNKVTFDQVTDSYTEMVETMLYPLLALFFFVLCLRGVSWIGAKSDKELRPKWLIHMMRQERNVATLLPTHETVGVFLLMAYPFLGYVVASVRGGMMSPRFVIPVCFGFAIAGSVTAYRTFGHLPRAGVVALCFCLAWFVARESVVGYWYVEQKQCFYKVLNRIPLAEAYVPQSHGLVVPDPLMVLTLQHYAPRVIAERIVFPVDFPAIRSFRHDDSPEQNIWAGRKTLYNVRVMPLATFQQSSGNYLVLASDGNWLLQDLDRHHYPERRLPINTRAGAIGGFTPLSKGLPAFYVAAGGMTSTGPLIPEDLPIPFTVSSNLPNAPELQ